MVSGTVSKTDPGSAADAETIRDDGSINNDDAKAETVSALKSVLQNGNFIFYSPLKNNVIFFHITASPELN